MKLALGSDHAGFRLKKEIITYLNMNNYECVDFGVFDEQSADYPDLAAPVTEAVNEGTCRFGILICGTGIGMSIAANKYPGIRAALCGEPYSARCAREHNDANILTMGARVIGAGLAADIVETFLNTSFAGGRHSQRLDKITRVENRR
ncbi:MAG TPA: ribose 5-phosphate isomerase B [Firmicutes bacterium]|nr:ribose 5-phosphate isomerase B [Bacillota bacterium]